MYDIGNWIGGVGTGLVTDKAGRRAIFMVPMIFFTVQVIRLFYIIH